MFGNFAAQAGILAWNEYSSPNIIQPNLSWNFNNVIVLDFIPPGIENLNDRPRINIWRDYLGNPDFNYLQYISGGFDVLSPSPTGTVRQPWGDRRTGTIIFPKTSILANTIIAGIDVFTHSFAPVKTGTLSPPISEWTVNATGVPGEIQYQYRFIVGQKNPQINVELDYLLNCSPVNIPSCSINQSLVFIGTGNNGCPIFQCQDNPFSQEIGSFYLNTPWADGSRSGNFGTWFFTQGTNSARNISNSNQNNRTSIGVSAFFIRGGSGSVNNNHIANFNLDSPVGSGEFLTIDTNYSWNNGGRTVDFKTGTSIQDWAFRFLHSGNDQLNLQIRSGNSVITSLIDNNAFNKAYQYRIDNFLTGLKLEVRSLSFNNLIYSNTLTGISNFINGLQIIGGGLSGPINLNDYNNYGIYINNIKKTNSPPLGPTVTVRNIETNSFVVDFVPKGFISILSYRLDVSTVSNFATRLVGYDGLTVDDISQQVTGLTAGTTYYIRARALRSNGLESENSDTLTQITVSVEPNAPTISNVTTTTFTATWNSVIGASEYRVDVATTSNFTSDFVINYNDRLVSETSVSVTGLNSNTTYYVRVRARNTLTAKIVTSANSPNAAQVTAS
jgi:hypothetical protein